ncbi:MAG TPA: hypothetical protein VKQ11_00395 [Candidatus Sulfotelmatobacter sp.]|nr:hypothetical protein [Candidatus Sulfotelmatobacter sp.]
MYSPLIVDQNTHKVQKALKLKLKRHKPAVSIERAKEIDALLAKKKAITSEDHDFIHNEQILCKLDFQYCANRYLTINIDATVGGGAGPLNYWEPQEMLMEKIGKKEEECHEQRSRGEPVDGILVACNKSRQIGFTMIWRCLSVHRLVLNDHTRGMAASLNSDLIREVYDRDKFMYQELPSFLKPAIVYDVKDEHLAFANNSRLIYQESSQKGAMGISRQFEIGHLTEVSQWQYPGVIQFDLMPAIPQSINTLFGMEAVPAGRGNFWHEFTEDCRKGKHPRWTYIFIPWYAEPKKYRRHPPTDWEPAEQSILHAKKVSETSHLYTRWQRYFLPKDNLYWWETTREEYRRAGNLNFFLSNWSATPQESFQHSGRSAFPTEFLERCRNRAHEGIPYDIATSTKAPSSGELQHMR